MNPTTSKPYKKRKKKKYFPKNRTYRPYPAQEMITKKQYFMKNFLFPFIVLGIMVVLSLIAVFNNEYGAWFVLIFSLTSLAVMMFFANRAYARYADLFNNP